MQGILVNISDHPTLPLKRKQEVFCFKVHWIEQTVELFLRLKHYEKLEDNSYGEEVTTPSINNYESKLVASNVRKVDATNGMECYYEVITPESTDEEGNVTPEVGQYKRMIDNVLVQNVMGQADFFDYIIHNQPVLIATMITQFVQFDDQVKNKWNK